MSPRKKNNSAKKSSSGALPMPSLIFNHVDFDEATASDSPREEAPQKPNKPAASTKKYQESYREHSARKIMWIGVGIFTVVIAIFWGISIRNHITNIHWGSTEEGKLVNTASTNLNQIYEETKIAEQKKNILNVLNTVLTSMTQPGSPSSTTSTALEATTTTTGIVSSTKQ